MALVLKCYKAVIAPESINVKIWSDTTPESLLPRYDNM